MLDEREQAHFRKEIDQMNYKKKLRSYHKVEQENKPAKLKERQRNK